MKALIDNSIDRLKPLWDLDTAKVVGAASVNFASNAITIDSVLKTIISILTIWYLWKKIHPKKKETENDEDL